MLAPVLPWDLAFHPGWMLAGGSRVETLTRIVYVDGDAGG